MDADTLCIMNVINYNIIYPVYNNVFSAIGLALIEDLLVQGLRLCCTEWLHLFINGSEVLMARCHNSMQSLHLYTKELHVVNSFCALYMRSDSPAFVLLANFTH